MDQQAGTNCNITTVTGRVKWFNNKAGYGFLTTVSDSKEGGDVFVHHSAIQTKDEQYNYLVQGEYVWFNTETVANKTHEVQASNVRGVYDGPLMCETRTLNTKEEDGWKSVKRTKGYRGKKE
jgi:cold shock CspA family protein